jgi:oligoribonuclease
MLVWMDLEMTGLDHTIDVIVEIATLVTDDELNIVAEGPDLVVHQPPEVLEAMDPFVVDMHTRSGLLDQISSSTITLEQAGAETLAFIRQHAPVAGTVPLCGNSIGTDRRFLARYLPEIEEYLHYRSVDVSSVKELVRRWYPDALNARGWKQGSHRALDDIRESVAELKLYRELVFAEPSVVAERVAQLKAFIGAAELEIDAAAGAMGDAATDDPSTAGADAGPESVGRLSR